jgi:isopentenyl-diphosphate Delta-isomerase
MSDFIPAWVGTTLTPVEKLEVHQLGLKHMAVSVFVMAGDAVLIQKRAAGKYHTPGLWANTCCTHPEWAEDPRDCAVRRLDEELGIRGVDPVWRDQVEYRADVGGGLTEHEVVEIFVADADKGLKLNLNPAEVSDTRWITLTDLSDDTRKRPDRYTPWLRIYLDQHMDRIFGMSRAG